MHFLGDLRRDRPFTLREASAALRLLESQAIALSRDRSDPPRLIGMESLVRRMIQAVVLGEHCLVEGHPGLAKTRAARAVARALGLAFQRIQFVPDLMPSDLIQRERLDLREGKAVIDWVPGPVFTNLLLADEINRASPKAQAALLEVTEEHHVTTLYRGREIVRPRKPHDEVQWLLDSIAFFGVPWIHPNESRGQVFTVLATMNPIEQEGVYPLSEAQLDRFAFKLVVDYPTNDALEWISAEAFEAGNSRTHHDAMDPEEHVKTLYFFTGLRAMLLGKEARDHWLSDTNDDLRRRVVNLIDFTHARPKRQDSEVGLSSFLGAPEESEGPKALELRALLSRRLRKASPQDDPSWSRLDHVLNNPGYPEVLSGASPRGLLKLIRAAHAEALMNDRFDPDDSEVLAPSWDDVRRVAPDVLRHRIRLTPQSGALGHRPEVIIQELLACLTRTP